MASGRPPVSQRSEGCEYGFSLAMDPGSGPLVIEPRASDRNDPTKVARGAGGERVAGSKMRRYAGARPIKQWPVRPDSQAGAKAWRPGERARFTSLPVSGQRPSGESALDSTFMSALVRSRCQRIARFATGRPWRTGRESCHPFPVSHLMGVMSPLPAQPYRQGPGRRRAAGPADHGGVCGSRAAESPGGHLRAARRRSLPADLV
jgi:hypothetical protein